MLDRSLRASIHAGVLLLALAVVAWVTGNPFVFPSLGPSAFVLVGIAGDVRDYRRVVAGHVIGIVVGLLVYHLLAPGLVVTDGFAPFSPGLFRLGLSGALSVALTTGGMLVTRTVHPPACATTLIVSLGLLARPVEGVIIAVAVVGLVVADYLLKRLVWRRVPIATVAPEASAVDHE